jgi:DNA polymerase III subunit epsilon
MPLKLDRPIVFFDIESTGTNVATDRIVEIAILKIQPDESKEMRIFRVNPGIPIPEEVVKIHGISNEDVADCPSFKDLAKDVLEFIGSADMAGYNSNYFDLPLLVEEFGRAGILFDTRNRRFVDVFKIFVSMERRDLQAAYKFYCNKEMVNAHNAEADILATYEVLQAQLQRYEELPNDLDKLHEISKDADFVDLGKRMIYVEGIPHFNFGKHKGRKVVDVLKEEPQYYDWIQRSEFLSDTKQKLKEIKMMMQLSTH